MALSSAIIADTHLPEYFVPFTSPDSSMARKKTQIQVREAAVSSASTKNNLTTHTFADFPAEIRNKIYHLLLAAKSTVHIHGYGKSIFLVIAGQDERYCSICIKGAKKVAEARPGSRTLLWLGIVKTCRQVYYEAVPIMLHTNKFLIHTESFSYNNLPTLWPTTWDGRLLRHLEIVRNPKTHSWHFKEARAERGIANLFPELQLLVTNVAIRRSAFTFLTPSLKMAYRLALAWRSWPCKVKLQVASGIMTTGAAPLNAVQQASVEKKLKRVKDTMLALANKKIAEYCIEVEGKEVLEEYMNAAILLGVDVE